jgi:molecular chaperone GrpE
MEEKEMKKEKNIGLDLTGVDVNKEIILEDNPRLHVSVLEDQLKEAEDKHVRLYADFENYKRRVQKDKEELVLNTKTKMLSSVLDMDNDVTLALKSMDKVDKGVLLIAQKLETFLKSQGIETIQTETYDDELHEVISVTEAGGKKVIDVVSKGYTLNGKPFRYPKVVLGK